HRRNLFYSDPPTSESKSIVNHHHIAKLGCLIGPSSAFVIAAMVLLNIVWNVFVDSADLVQAEIFIPSMAVQSQDTGRLSGRIHRLQDHCFGGISAWELIADFFKSDAIEDASLMDGDFRN